MNQPVAPVQFASVIGASSHAGGGPLPPPDAWTHHGPFISYADGVVVGNPVGGNCGDGNLNAQGLFVDGVPVSLGGDFVEIAGDGMTGPLVLYGDPQSPLEAATKQYVDAKSGAVVPPTITPPTAPAPGTMWFDPIGLQLYVWFDDGNSAQWVVAINHGGSSTLKEPSSLVVSATPPINAAQGAMWFNSSDLQIYIRYDDGTSAQWVVGINQMAATTAIANLTHRLGELEKQIVAMRKGKK